MAAEASSAASSVPASRVIFEFTVHSDYAPIAGILRKNALDTIERLQPLASDCKHEKLFTVEGRVYCRACGAVEPILGADQFTPSLADLQATVDGALCTHQPADFGTGIVCILCN